MNTCDKIYSTNSTQPQYPAFSERLKTAMAIRQYSVEDLATRTHTSHSTISMYRSGKRLPNIEILRLIAKELRVSSDYLLGLSDFFFV